MTQKGSENRIKKWLNESPIVTCLVVGAALIGFVLSVLNGGFTFWKEFSEYKNSPTLTLRGMTALNEKKTVNANAFIGLRTTGPTDLPLADNMFDLHPKGTTEVPCYPTTLFVTNPRGQPLSIIDLQLVVRFAGGSQHESKTYVFSEGGEKTDSFHPVIYLNPRESKWLEIDFLFFPQKKFMEEWESSPRFNEFEYFVVWLDDAGNENQTPVKLFPGGAVFVPGS